MKNLVIIGIVLITLMGWKLVQVSPGPPANVQKVINYFSKGSVDFNDSALKLVEAIQGIDSNKPSTLFQAKKALINCRKAYKHISFFVEYFYPNQARFYNAPAKYEIEEPYMEFEKPRGLQYIEQLLYCENPGTQKIEMLQESRVISESAFALNQLLYQEKISDGQVFESLRIELIRIMALYITGYDAPFLKSGLAESIESLQAIQNIVFIYAERNDTRSERFIEALRRAINYLTAHQQFDSFNRLVFLSQYCIPLEEALRLMGEPGESAIGGNLSMDPNAANLFKGEIVAPNRVASREILLLGERLFFDKKLSGDGSRSCASCHNPEKYYADGLSRNLDFDRQAHLNRNTATLMYSGYQYAQFWDGRSKTLENQALEVLTNAHEMHGSVSTIEKRINADSLYGSLFRREFNLKGNDTIQIKQITIALASYVASLNPQTSAFDRYMSGNKKAMTPAQEKGFNLFMGKAQCGTCHFIPFFNGLTPPYYNKTEFEVIGTTASDNLKLLQLDPDLGRYSFFPSEYYKSAFKTPTLRNISKTGPYMHNGAFSSLEKVLEFYNQGGGKGLGLQIENQTLASTALHLTKKEIRQVLEFLEALTDKLPLTPETSRK